MVECHFDPLICCEIDVDHGLQIPIPTPQRMWDLGIVVHDAIANWNTDEKIVVKGTGGLSHQLQGSRAGFINEVADKAWIAEIGSDP